MKTLPLLLTAALLSACAHTPKGKPEQRTAPTLSGIGAKINDAQTSTVAAQGNSTRIATHGQTLRSNASRIDDKATVVLKYLQ